MTEFKTVSMHSQNFIFLQLTIFLLSDEIVKTSEKKFLPVPHCKMLRFLLLVFSIVHLAKSQDYINANCQQWSQWIQGGNCVMPNMLAGVLQQRCPAAQIPGWFFCGTNDIFAYLNQPCGQCTVNFQCRSRQIAYACSPTLEVERIPCQYQINNQPCILNGNLCSMAGFPVMQYGRRRKRDTENKREYDDVEHFDNETLKLFNDNGLYISSTYPRPSLNCVQDTTILGGGCRCCCFPYRPIGTQCIM